MTLLEPRDEQRDRDGALLSHCRVAQLQHVQLPEPLQNPITALFSCHGTSGESTMHRASVLDTRGLSSKEEVVHRYAQLLIKVARFSHPIKGVGTKCVLIGAPVRY